jgi:FtsZ-binding cell division protein ZapB
MTHDDDTCPHLVRYAMMWNKNEDGSIYVSPWPSALSGDWVKYEDYARLKAEVERLTKQNALATPRHLIASQDIKTLREQIEELKLENSQYEEHHKYGQNVITSLREEVERLTKAGDGVLNSLDLCYMGKKLHLLPSVIAWNAAKEGKGQP